VKRREAPLKLIDACFAVLMGIAVFCFLGFSYALWTLGRGRYVLFVTGALAVLTSKSLRNKISILADRVVSLGGKLHVSADLE
jgi:hypothetical protein